MMVTKMDKHGIDIENHTVHHDNLTMISKEKQLKTLIQSPLHILMVGTTKVQLRL